MSVKSVPGGVARRMGERAFGLVLLAKVFVIGAFAVLLVVAGALTSWNASQDSFRDNREQGTLLVRSCGKDTCTGTFSPEAGGAPRAGAVIDKTVARKAGARLEVAVKPGTRTVVRTGPPGFLYSFVPLGGALLLAALLLAGGLGLRRTALGFGLGGAVLVGAAFLAL